MDGRNRDDIVLAVLRLADTNVHGGGDYLSGVQVLLQPSTTTTTMNMPVVTVPISVDTESTIVSWVAQLIGSSTVGCEIHFINNNTLPRLSRRRPLTLAILLLKEATNQPKSSQNNPTPPSFIALNTAREGKIHCGKQTQEFSNFVARWLHDQCSAKPHTRPLDDLRLLFTSVSSLRIKSTSLDVLPSRQAFAATAERLYSSAETLPQASKTLPCNIVVTNPLIEAGLLNYRILVDLCVQNPFWLRGVVPDVKNIGKPSASLIRQSQVTKTATNWSDDFPMHAAALHNDVDLIKSLLQSNASPLQRDRVLWAPLHYAARYGQLAAVQLLLRSAYCPADMAAGSEGLTPLHLAAVGGQIHVVEFLLQRVDVDQSATDLRGRTPLALVEHMIRMPGAIRELWKCAELLRNAPSVPSIAQIQFIPVHLMDGTTINLKLVAGPGTSVQQLQLQMLEELGLPHSCYRVFAFWICSNRLQVQLGTSTCPKQHLDDWPRFFAEKSDCEPSREEPMLFWKRNARLSVLEEKQIQQVRCLNLLYNEALSNYLKSLYPCADEDVFVLGALLFHLDKQIGDLRRAKQFLGQEKVLRRIVPSAKLSNKQINWSNKLFHCYKQTMNWWAGKRDEELQYKFLSICWNLTVYGSAFFTGYLPDKNSRHHPVYIGINDIGVHVIDGKSKIMVQSFHYVHIDWSFDNSNPNVIVIRSKSNQKNVASLHSKQASMIQSLMNKLCLLYPGSGSGLNPAGSVSSPTK